MFCEIGNHYTYSSVFFKVPKDNRPQERIPLQNTLIIAAGSYDNMTLFASEKHGVVKLLQLGVEEESFQEEYVTLLFLLT